MSYKMKGSQFYGKSPFKQDKGKIVGENTGEIKEDKKGKYSLIMEDTDFALKGDTVRFTPNTHIVDDTYIEGGDYNATKEGKTIKIDKQK